MPAKVLEFKTPTRPIAQFVRIDVAHRRLGNLVVLAIWSSWRSVCSRAWH